MIVAWPEQTKVFLKYRTYGIVFLAFTKTLLIEISSTKSKNIILNTIYRSPNGDMKQCKTNFKDFFSKNGKNLKNKVLAGDKILKQIKKCKTF